MSPQVFQKGLRSRSPDERTVPFPGARVLSRDFPFFIHDLVFESALIKGLKELLSDKHDAGNVPGGEEPAQQAGVSRRESAPSSRISPRSASPGLPSPPPSMRSKLSSTAAIEVGLALYASTIKAFFCVRRISERSLSGTKDSTAAMDSSRGIPK